MEKEEIALIEKTNYFLSENAHANEFSDKVRQRICVLIGAQWQSRITSSSAHPQSQLIMNGNVCWDTADYLQTGDTSIINSPDPTHPKVALERNHFLSVECIEIAASQWGFPFVVRYKDATTGFYHHAGVILGQQEDGEYFEFYKADRRQFHLIPFSEMIEMTRSSKKCHALILEYEPILR